MVLTDRLMAGVYPSFPDAVRTIVKADGWRGFYIGWWPALAQKIPSYGYVNDCEEEEEDDNDSYGDVMMIVMIQL